MTTLTVHLRDLPFATVLDAALYYLRESSAGWQEPVEYDGTTAVLHSPHRALVITA